MTCCCRVPHQHHIFVIPALADNAWKLHPHRRTAQMGGIRHQVMATEMTLENLAAGFDRFFFGHRLEAPAIPCLRHTFNNEGRGAVIKLIDMRPDPTMLRLFKNKGEGIIKFLMRAKPHEFAQACINIRLKHIDIFIPHNGINTVCRNHQIIILPIVFSRFELGFKP